MKITRENYEEYFLDYLEGNLDKNLLNEFKNFLVQNPDLKDELENTGNFKAEPESFTFLKKENLFKSRYEHETEFNKAAVARMEGDLTDTETEEFEKFLKENPEKLYEAELFEKTRLTADETIVFRNKSTLYRQPAGKKIVIWSVRIAAVLVIAFFISRIADYFLNPDVLPENRIVVSDLKKNLEDEKPESVPFYIEKEEIKMPIPEADTETIKKETEKIKSVQIVNSTLKSKAEQQYIAEGRVPVELPAKIASRNVSLTAKHTNLSLLSMNSNFTETEEKILDERLLADIVKEKTGFEKITLSKIVTAGLNIVSAVTGQKFSYQTNDEGRVKELNFDSHLLAFDIPVNKDDR